MTLQWARRLVALRRQVATAASAAGREAEGADTLAAAAFVEARALATEPGSLQAEGFRALYLDAQALYEHFHGGVRPPALSGPDLATLRAPWVEALAAGAAPAEGAPLPAVAVEAAAAEAVAAETAAAEVLAAAAAVPAHLFVPAGSERAVAQQAAWVNRALGGGAGVTRRGRSYFGLIDRELARRGLPRELRYVAVIESGLDAGAVSPAGALGLWQMIPATGEMYGLDEAGLLDPARSTRAAARHLERLGAQFDGDWQLVLAAYNWGPARVASLVARERRRLGRTPTFWDLYDRMPTETRAYVSRFIAVARAVG
ncbi:MAG TPA: lytic transglycosylase domain-containing protein [Rhodothermales bacterium]|nr:lytic transglycosylase domain-containing protein [Rhodothermales bacterium]